MKKINIFLALLMLIMSLGSPVLAEDYADVEVYKHTWSTSQGTDGWYYATFVNNEPSLMVWDTDGKFWSAPGNIWTSIRSNGSMLPGTGMDVGLVWKAPVTGMITIRGKDNLYAPWGEAYAAGDGVIVSIMKGSQVLWTTLVKYGDRPSYEVSTPIRAGEEIKFIMNINKNNAYDDFVWKPTVAYTTQPYQAEKEDGVTYLENVNGELNELEFDASNDIYRATEEGAYITSHDMMITEETSFVKRFIAPLDSRYRINGEITIPENRGGGLVLRILKNSEVVWQQLAPEGETTKFDFRLLADKDDIIDAEIGLNTFAGFNYATWSCGISRVPGVISEVSASSGLGYNYLEKKEIKLSDLLSKTGSGATPYLKKNSVKFPMSFSSADNVWKEDNDETANVKPGSVTVTTNDVVIDVTVPESGRIRLSGATKLLTGTSDGVLAKVYKNGTLIWSNRVGGERSVRWDEPFDVSYFQNVMNVFEDVNKDDIISFTFNCWRNETGDTMDLSDIKITYINGSPLSKTAKWKLMRSTLLNTASQTAYINGVRSDINTFLENGTTYIAQNDAVKIFGENYKSVEGVVTQNGVNYLPLRKLAVNNDSNVWWTAGGSVLISKELPIFFGYSDLSEIDIAMKEGDLF